MTKLLFETFIDDLKKETTLTLAEFQEKIRRSVNDFKTETANLRNDLAAETEKFKEKLNL